MARAGVPGVVPNDRAHGNDSVAPRVYGQAILNGGAHAPLHSRDSYRGSFAIPTAAFSEDITIGPGGVRIGPSYGQHRYYNRAEGGRCAELRQARLHKQELGEQGMGNCQRYRAMCH
jgi:hypothetical protein